MSKRPAKPRTGKKPTGKTVIMFGLDKERKPHGARFTGESDVAMARTAALMGLRLAVPYSRKHFEVVNKLPATRIPATGNTVVPIIDHQLYAQINSLVGGEPPKLAAARAHKQIEPIEIGELGVALGRPDVADPSVVQHGVLVLASPNKSGFGASNCTSGASACKRTEPDAPAPLWI